MLKRLWRRGRARWSSALSGCRVPLNPHSAVMAEQQRFQVEDWHTFWAVVDISDRVHLGGCDLDSYLDEAGAALAAAELNAATDAEADVAVVLMRCAGFTYTEAIAAARKALLS